MPGGALASRAWLALALLCAAPHGAHAAAPLDFELYALGSDRLVRLSQLRRQGRLVLVDFFSESCKPCRRALPVLSRLHRELHGRGLRLVLVAVPDDLAQRDASRQRLRRLMAAQRLPFPVVWDKYLLTAKRFGVARKGTLHLPQAFVLDARGRLLKRHHQVQALGRLLRARLGRPH